MTKPKGTNRKKFVPFVSLIFKKRGVDYSWKKKAQTLLESCVVMWRNTGLNCDISQAYRLP